MTLDREQLDGWLEKGILGFFLGALLYAAVALGATHFVDVARVSWLVMGALVLWVVRLWVGPGYRLLWPPVCWVVLLFTAYAVFRYHTSEIEYVAREEMIKVILYAAIFFVILNNLHRQETIQIILVGLVLLGLVEALYAIYQYATNSPTILGAPKLAIYGRRASGTYYCPNHLAGFLEMVLPLGVAYAFVGRLGHVWRIVLLYSSLVIAGGIIVTLSRGGWASSAMACALLVVLLLRKPQARLPVLAFLAVLVICATIFFNQDFLGQKRATEKATAKATIEDVRFQLFKPAIRMWRDNFWLGAGLAHFDYKFEPYRPWHAQFRPERVHNDYLNTLADWGLVGFLIVATALGLIVHGLFVAWKYSSKLGSDLGSGQSNRLAALIGMGVGFAAILCHSFVDLNMHIAANALVCISFLALMTSYWRFATERFWVRPHWTARLAISLLAMVAIGYLVRESLVRLRERQLIREANRAPARSKQQLDLLQQSFALQPTNFETAYRIGENLRLISFEGNKGYQQYALEAIQWFDTTLALNPYDLFAVAKKAMCLDWLEEPAEAAKLFDRIQKEAQFNPMLLGYVGWHYIQVGDLPRAREFLQRSSDIRNNSFATFYLHVIDTRLMPKPAR